MEGLAMNKRTLYKRMLVGALALAVAAATVYGIMQRVGTAHANATTYEICMNNPTPPFTTRCMELQFDLYQTGRAIVLDNEQLNSPPDMLRWTRFPVGNVNSGTFKNSTFDTNYNGDPIYYLEKKTPSGHNGCIGVANTGLLGWETCGTFGTQWVYSGNEYFVSVGKTNQVNGSVPWLLSLQPNTSGSCQAGTGVPLEVSPQGSGNCNSSFSFIQV
jgi:hypothetical protein